MEILSSLGQYNHVVQKTLKALEFRGECSKIILVRLPNVSALNLIG